MPEHNDTIDDTIDDTTDVLNHLIETCKDGEYGFRTCAERTHGASLQRFFEDRAQQCADSAAELQALVQQHGGHPQSSGSAAGAMHRGWVSLKLALGSQDDLAVLEEAERGEDAAIDRYRKALDKRLGTTLRPVVVRQYEGALRNHEQVRALRDQARSRRAN